MNGMIEDATGDLLMAGFCTCTPGAGETMREDVPEPAKIRYAPGNTQMHRWTGSQWSLVDNPARPPQKSQDVILKDADGELWKLGVTILGILTTTKVS